MILFSLKCSHDHEFDEWFDNSGDYAAKAEGHQIACPECGDTNVAKAMMAPRIGKSAAPEPRCAPGGCGACSFAHD